MTIRTSGKQKSISKWQKWENNPLNTTTEETWQTVLNRTAKPVKAGTYRISWTFEIRISPTGPVNSLASARFLLDDLPIALTNTAQETWVGYSRWDFIQLSDGDTPNLQVQIQRDPGIAGNDTVEIRRVKMSIEQMPE